MCFGYGPRFGFRIYIGGLYQSLQFNQSALFSLFNTNSNIFLLEQSNEDILRLYYPPHDLEVETFHFIEIFNNLNLRVRRSLEEDFLCDYGVHHASQSPDYAKSLGQFSAFASSNGDIWSRRISFPWLYGIVMLRESCLHFEIHLPHIKSFLYPSILTDSLEIRIWRILYPRIIHHRLLLQGQHLTHCSQL